LLKQLGGGNIISGIKSVGANIKKHGVWKGVNESLQKALINKEVSGNEGIDRSKSFARLATKMNAQKEFTGINRYKALTDEEKKEWIGMMDDPGSSPEFKKKLASYAGGITEEVDPTYNENLGESAEEKAATKARQRGQEMKKRFELERRQREHMLNLRAKEDELALTAMRTGKEGIDQVVLQSSIEDERHHRATARRQEEIKGFEQEIANQQTLQAFYEKEGLKKEALDAKIAQARLKWKIDEKKLIQLHAEEVERVRQEEEKVTEEVRKRTELRNIENRELSQKKAVAGVGKDIAMERATQRGATEEERYQIEYDHNKRMLSVDRERAQLDLQRAQRDVDRAGNDARALEAANNALDVAKHELQMISLQNQLLDEQLKTFQERDMRRMADDWASAWTGAFGSILDQIEQGNMDFSETITGLGKNLIDSAIKPLMEDIQAELNKMLISLFSGMSSTMRGLFSGLIGGALLGLGSFLKGQKEDVESLADDASQEIIDNTEKVRGLVAGQTQIGIAKMSENLGMALRPTNEILLRIEKLLGGTGGGAGNGVGAMTITQESQQGGFAMEVIGASRV
jgi:hypothetical protein